MKNTDTQIEEILSSINEMQQAETSYFFHSRVEARLNRQLAAAAPQWLPNPQAAWILSALLLSLSINIFSVIHFNKTESATATNNADNASIEGFSNTYHLRSNSPY